MLTERTASLSQLTWYGRQPRKMAVYTRLNCDGNACQSRLSELVKKRYRRASQ